MTDGLADTSLFIARESGRPVRNEALPDRLAVSVVTVGELRVGVLAATSAESRFLRLVTLTQAVGLGPVPIDDSVAEVWAGLRIALRDLGLRMPVNDSWIAATAIHLGVPVVTQDDDYESVPGLTVIRV
jgi:predicted nucleic acid-binding protein